MQSGRPLRLTEKLLYSTIKIEAKLKDGNNSVGTGFLYKFFRTEESSMPVIVTNKHVVKNALTGRLLINVADNSGNVIHGQQVPFTISEFEGGWVNHPDSNVDLCVMPIGAMFAELQTRSIKPFMAFIDASQIPSDGQWDKFGAIEQVIMIGYPDGLWDSKNNLPIIRKGITATHPNVDYRGEKKFLIDAAVYPGSSGSPVFIFNEGFYADSDTQVVAGDRLFLIGINHAVHQHKITGEVVVEDTPTQSGALKSYIPNNLGIIIRSTRLKEFEPELRELIEKSR